MAAYDLEEQEQIDDLKAWWTQWGNLVTWVALAAAVGILGVQGWRWWQAKQAAEAGVLFDAVAAAVKANDTAKAKEAVAQLEERFGGTGYAPRGALLAAKVLFDAGDAAGAKAQLMFVLDRAGEDELKQVARVRLAAIQFDAKQYDDALRTLDAKHDEPFAGVYADLRGDVLAAAGRTGEARTAYETALTKLDAKAPYHSLVQAKLDAIGGPQGIAGAAGAAAPASAATSSAAPSPASGTAPSTAPSAPPAAVPGAPAPKQ